MLYRGQKWYSSDDLPAFVGATAAAISRFGDYICFLYVAFVVERKKYALSVEWLSTAKTNSNAIELVFPTDSHVLQRLMNIKYDDSQKSLEKTRISIKTFIQFTLRWNCWNTFFILKKMLFKEYSSLNCMNLLYGFVYVAIVEVKWNHGPYYWDILLKTVAKSHYAVIDFAITILYGIRFITSVSQQLGPDGGFPDGIFFIIFKRKYPLTSGEKTITELLLFGFTCGVILLRAPYFRCKHSKTFD